MAEEPKTIRVRIAVAIDRHGGWRAHGWASLLDAENYDAITATKARVDLPNAALAHVFVEADIPIPETQTIEGQVYQ